MRPARKTQRGVTPTTGSPTIARWTVTKRCITQTALIAILACGSSGLNATNSNRESAATYSFDIPAQKVEDALSQLAQQTGHQLLFSYPLVDALDSSAVQGTHTVTRALQQLLQNTTLSGRLTERGVIIVTDARYNSDKGRGNMMINTNKRKNLLATFIAMFATGATAQGVDSNQQAATQQNQIDEIIVTASKRGAGQSIQDTAMAISALSGDTIEKRGLVGMDDYLRTLPGVSMQDRGAGQNSIVIRGIAANPQVETQAVGVYFGETPITGLGSNSSSGSSGNGDIKLVDIERIEVLRGPQGTLYGSGSMGGTVRVLPNKPNLEEIEGSVASRFSQTAEKGGDNTMLQGVLNIPLIEDTLAIRAVAYQFDNSGYIENVGSTYAPLVGAIAAGGGVDDRGDVGADKYTGLRLTTLWQPTDELSVTLGYIQQEIEQEGLPEVNLTLGDFEQARLGVGSDGSRSEFIGNDVDITNLIFEYDLGWGSVMSTSSWIDYDSLNNVDFTELLSLFGLSAPMDIRGTEDTEKFIEELRLTSQLDGSVQFLLGFYYEDEDYASAGPIMWSGVPTFSAFDTLQFVTRSTTQKALFGELSYQMTDELTATLGARYFEYDQDSLTEGSGALIGAPVFDPKENSDNGDNFKASLTYTPNEDILIYGQWAEGFRLGEPKKTTPVTCDVDQDGNIDALGVPSRATSPDELESFELGIKTAFADNRIRLNAAIYRINWEGIPVSIATPSPCAVAFLFNAGKSKSEGIELELQAHVTESFRLDVSAAYGEATLTEDVPNVTGFGSAGDSLPGSSDYNISLAAEYSFSFAGFDSFVRGDYSYVGRFYNNFTESGLASGDYGQLNLKLGTSFDQIDVDLFVNNVTNEDEFTWIESGLGGFGFSRAYRLRPRTMGLNLAYKF